MCWILPNTRTHYWIYQWLFLSSYENKYIKSEIQTLSSIESRSSLFDLLALITTKENEFSIEFVRNWLVERNNLTTTQFLIRRFSKIHVFLIVSHVEPKHQSKPKSNYQEHNHSCLAYAINILKSKIIVTTNISNYNMTPQNISESLTKSKYLDYPYISTLIVSQTIFVINSFCYKCISPIKP